MPHILGWILGIGFLLIILFLIVFPIWLFIYLWKKSKGDTLIALGVFALVIFFIFPFSKEEDWYCFHVWECEECHKLNRTFSVCSGFCYDPSDKDLDFNSPCAIHPSEICEDHVAHGSNLGSTIMVWGIRGLIFTDTSICVAQDRPIEIIYGENYGD